MIDVIENSVLGGILGFAGSQIRIPGITSGRNSFQAIFLSGIRKLVNGTGVMHLKTAVKGFISQYIISAGAAGMTKLYDWFKEKLEKCVED